MKKLEYKIEDIPLDEDPTNNWMQLEATLSRCGLKGWLLCSVMQFQKPKHMLCIMCREVA